MTSTDLQMANKRIAELEADLEAAKGQKAFYQKELSEFQTKLDEARSVIASQNTQLNNLKAYRAEAEKDLSK